MSQTWNIIDNASGAVVAVQTWAEQFAPCVLAGQHGVPVNVSIAGASGTLTSAAAGAAVAVSGNFNFSVWGTFVATLVLERSFDGGTTWLPVTFSDGSTVTFSVPLSTTWAEPEKGVLSRVRCTAFTSGAVNWRISQ